MKTFILCLTAILALASEASTHCPVPLNVENQFLCVDIRWQNAETKVRSKLLPSTEPSPQLVLMGTKPKRWLYSKASILIWKRADSNHQPVKVEGLSIFPYMHMKNGHHHSTSYKFDYDAKLGAYTLHSFKLMEMNGCWSLRWTTKNTDSAHGSQLLIPISTYANLSAKENQQLREICKSQSTGGHPEGHGGHKGHKH